MKKLLCGIFCILMIATATSCGELDSERARTLAEPLIEASQKLDVILYGEGLGVSDVKEGKYSQVADDTYKSIEDIKSALERVYTPELCEIIRNSTLKSSTSEHGTSYARYINIDGVLYKYDEAKVYVTHPRRYDTTTIIATNMTDRRIILTVDTYTADAEGNYSETAENIELKLIYDDGYGKWLLDTPTY